MGTKDLEAAFKAMSVARCIELFCCEKSPHWYAGIGEEAVPVGTFGALGPDDFAAPHYRAALIVPWLRGRRLRDVLGCVIQRRSSPTGGRLYGGFAGALEFGVLPYVTMVLGPNLGVAAGVALAFQTRGEPRVAVATLGDGTAGTGDFHEALNLAASLALPCVFVCQNNQFSISTSTRKTLAGKSIADWASRYGIDASQVDGNDVEAVRDAVLSAVSHARDGHGPAFVEALTYRRTGHFAGDPAKYRSPEEADEWLRRDPIERARSALKARGIPESHLDSITRESEAAVADAAIELAGEPELTAADLGIEEHVNV
jgi:TPP-dependent pyruvate/acetoin dehydrogenase alpha subunit